MTRRGALAGLGGSLGAAVLAVLTGCSTSSSTDPAVPKPRRIAYGDDRAQFGELTRPSGRSRGVVVVIHGGYWTSSYGLELGRPLAKDLAARGYTAWNIEYRRVGTGGGVPHTLDDVAAAIDRLADIDGLDLSRVVALGHSAGGQLAAWAAARGRFDRWKAERVTLTAVVSQAGVLDLRGGAAANLGGGAIPAFLGDQPDDDRVDPTQQLPLDVPVRCVHGLDDTIVPMNQSADYVARARKAGADATLTRVPGDHFALITTSSEAWRTIVGILGDLVPSA